MSSHEPVTVVVVPALDEEASIAEVVRGFAAEAAVAAVIVVDNGSRDRTAERARAAGARVIAEARRGYGAALRAGIEHALAGGAERVALVEADGTFDPLELERLLAPLAGQAPMDLVLGSRRADLPGLLGLGNHAVARLLALLWPRRSCALTDVGCTYRAFRAPAWAALRAGVGTDGPEFAPQMIAEAFRRRLRVVEVPVRYRARAGGRSKHTGGLATLRTAARMLRAILAKRCEPAPGP
jgi:glycosyltransferase involved in cell wall biosynthesis